MQNKRFLQLTIAAILISVCSYFYVKCSMDKIEVDGVELKSEHINETDRISLGFFDMELAQKIGSSFKFLQNLK